MSGKAVEGLGHGRQRWYSIYAYPHGTLDDFFDKYLNHLIRFLQSRMSAPDSAYFVVRYHDRHGPHIRIRVAHSSSEYSVHTLFPREGTDGGSWRGAVRDGHFLLDFSLRLAREVRYRPEVGRYGGPRRIAISEQYFMASSKWILTERRQSTAPYEKRLVTAAICARILLDAAISDTSLQRELVRLMVRVPGQPDTGLPADIQNHLHQTWQPHQDGWNRCFDAVARLAVLSPGEAQSAFHRWKLICQETLALLHPTFASTLTPTRSYYRIITSWIHMHNNRLGILPHDELLINYAMLKNISK